MKIDFQPKLLVGLRHYSREKFIADLMAGIIVGIVALPLAIAFGIASGVTPEKGLITAIVGGFIVSALGGSSVQIGGPTGAFIVIVFGIIQGYGLEGLAIAPALAGAMLIMMGLFRLGGIIKFIPYPIVVGFTSGIALTIFTTQVKDLLGLTIDKLPADCLSQWAVYFRHLDTINPLSLFIGVARILIIAVMPKISRKIPGSLVAIIIMTVVAYLMKEVWGITGIETIGDRFDISNEIPDPQPLHLDMATINQLLSPAFTIAILCAIESLLSATVADGVRLNGMPVKPCGGHDLKKCIVSTGDFSRKKQEWRDIHYTLIGAMKDEVARIRMFGAACVDFAYLASGRTDIHIRFVNKLWDFMPGLFMARVSGAYVDEELLSEKRFLLLTRTAEEASQYRDIVLSQIDM